VMREARGGWAARALWRRARAHGGGPRAAPRARTRKRDGGAGRPETAGGARGSAAAARQTNAHAKHDRGEEGHVQQQVLVPLSLGVRAVQRARKQAAEKARLSLFLAAGWRGHCGGLTSKASPRPKTAEAKRERFREPNLGGLTTCFRFGSLKRSFWGACAAKFYEARTRARPLTSRGSQVASRLD